MVAEAIEKLRGIVKDCISKHLYSTAIFFADKIPILTSDPADIYMQAQALFLGGQYRRAFHILMTSKIVDCDLRFRFLAAKCLAELKEWHHCLGILGDAKIDEHGNVQCANELNAVYMVKDGDQDINIASAICFLRGKAYEALENRSQACLWYKAAITADIFCYEALERLIESHMLTCKEEESLMDLLQLSREDEWLSTFYSWMIKKDAFIEKSKNSEDNGENLIEDSSLVHLLKNDIDLLVCKAEYLQQTGEFQKSFELTSGVLERDPFHLKCTVVHLTAATELGYSNELYLLAGNLVKDHPQKALSWFAVGCYYYCIKKFSQSHQYFCKATKLDAMFSPAWIGFANALSAKSENDQAMSAYRTAARLFPGYHLPVLYIGMEYTRSHTFRLAEQFFMQAKSICPSDPLIYNELGVVAYHTKNYEKAIEWFEMSLSLLPSSLSESWESTLINLGHAMRKLKMYNEAIMYYERAFTVSAKSFGTYAGLAYTYHLQDNIDAAISFYHKALWLRPDDQFCTEMLTFALEESQNGSCLID